MKRKKIVILGAGLVGGFIAEDLIVGDEFDVIACDLNIKRLNKVAQRTQGKTEIREIDLSDCKLVRHVASDADLIIGALPSHIGFNAIRAVIQERVPCVDISFTSEDFRVLDLEARDAGVPVIVDFGVAPGMSNLLAGIGVSRLTSPSSVEIVVGGLPVERVWPWEYKAGFSPFDVIEEYMRPSRIKRNNKLVVREALTEVENIELPGVGTVEAFNSDGLRSLLDTLDVPNMRERTLRWPGHAKKMSYLRHLGLFSMDSIDISGQSVVPRDLTAALLFPQWEYHSGEQDLTVMKVEVEGILDGKIIKHKWDLLDYGVVDEGHFSMARTTALPCVSVARLLARGHVVPAGVHVPESLVNDSFLVDFIFDEQKKRGIEYQYNQEFFGPSGDKKC